jgi:hypothetical protein
MKIKIRPYEASSLEEDWLAADDWLATDDWLAELRAVAGGEPPGHGEPPGDGQAEPASPRASRPEAAGAAGVLAGDFAAAGTFPDAGAADGTFPDAGAADAGTAVRAVIGDQLRMPAMWCEMGSCRSRYTDPAAVGEADIRARAIGAGWRIDAFGRLACPRCQQADPAFRASCPATLWNRDDAIAGATRLAEVDTGPARMEPQAAWRTS